MVDVGDEAAKDAGALAADIFKWLIDKSGNVLSSKVRLERAAKSKMKEQAKRAGRTADLTSEQDLGSSENHASCYEVCAVDKEELVLLAKAFDEGNLEYYVSKDAIDEEIEDIDPEFAEPGKDGLYRLWVPDREEQVFPFTRFCDAEKELQEIVKVNSYKEVAARLGLNTALGASFHAPNVDFTKGAKDNIKFEFKTVSWDREGYLLKNHLNSANIAYVARNITQDTIRFEIPLAHAETVSNLISYLNNNVKGFNKKRFERMEALQEACRKDEKPDTVLHKTVEGKENYERVCDALDATDIAYQSYFDSERGVGTLSFSAKQVAANKDSIPTDRAAIEKILETAKAQSKSLEGKTAPIQGFDLKEIRQKSEQASYSTPAKDEAQVRQASKLFEKEPQRQINRSREGR